MKTYRFEDWDLLTCPVSGDNTHVGGKIYGHDKLPDGTLVMSSHAVYFDNEKMQILTRETGLIQLGEPSKKFKTKIERVDKERKEEDEKRFAGQGPLTLMQDEFMTGYNPEEWDAGGEHSGVQDAQAGLSDLLNKIFGGGPGREGPTHH